MKETVPGHIMIKLFKTSNKKKILENNLMYKGTNIKMTAYFWLGKKLHPKRQRDNFKTLGMEHGDDILEIYIQ